MVPTVGVPGRRGKARDSFLAVGGAKGRGWGHLDKFPYIIIVSKTSSEEKKI